jgi:hypothetical protein
MGVGAGPIARGPGLCPRVALKEGSQVADNILDAACGGGDFGGWG